MLSATNETNVQRQMSVQSDPDNFIYIVSVVDGMVDSLEFDGYRGEELETEEEVPNGWYRVIVPEYKENADNYPVLDDECTFEEILDPRSTEH